MSQKYAIETVSKLSLNGVYKHEAPFSNYFHSHPLACTHDHVDYATLIQFFAPRERFFMYFLSYNLSFSQEGAT